MTEWDFFATVGQSDRDEQLRLVRTCQECSMVVRVSRKVEVPALQCDSGI